MTPLSLTMVIAFATLLAIGQGAWAEPTEHFTNNPGVEEGTEALPFLIENIEDLNNLAADVNSGTDYSDKYFKLMANLNYSGETFTPIGKGEELGTDDLPFKGIFDGNEKTISNITYSDGEGVGVGLFGYIFSPAQIKDVTLKDCSFTGNSGVGAIVGNSSGTGEDFGIYNCTVIGGSVTYEGTIQVCFYTGTSDFSDDTKGTIAGDCIPASASWNR